MQVSKLSVLKSNNFGYIKILGIPLQHEFNTNLIQNEKYSYWQASIGKRGQQDC